ncbi:MAG: hypothetical protein Q8T11_03145 [Elusimicrobiota bacterium]|nr:hypothetical protein [Elusimicrobiota bacterium]
MRRRFALTTLSLISAAAALAATAWHIARNAAPPTFDDAWYLETSFRLFSALKAGSGAFVQAYVEAFRIKAPLISLVPLPLYALFGMGERVAVWANLPLAALAAWSWSRAAALWWRDHPRGKDAAALGGALVALTPLAYGLSRFFFVETLLSALLGLWAWRCAAARPGDRREGIRLGLILGLGLLAKSTFPLLAAGFAWPARERLRPQAKRVMFVGGLLAATWYAANLPYVLGFAWSAGFGSVARDYAGAGGLAARLDWLTTILRDGLSWPLASAMAATGAAAAISGKKSDAGTRAALWGLAPLLVYAAGVNREPRLIAPLLPVVALLAARASVSFERTGLRAAAAAALLGAGLAVCAERTFHSAAPSADPGWSRVGLVDAVAASNGRVAAVALESPRLNANNLSSLAAARGLGLKFVSLGYAQTSAETALIRLKDKSCDTLIFVEGAPEPDSPAFLNRANAGVLAMTVSGRLKTSPAARVTLAPGVTATVLRLIW